jgi:hypothetical protein
MLLPGGGSLNRAITGSASAFVGPIEAAPDASVDIPRDHHCVLADHIDHLDMGREVFGDTHPAGANPHDQDGLIDGQYLFRPR